MSGYMYAEEWGVNTVIALIAEYENSHKHAVKDMNWIYSIVGSRTTN